MTTATMPAGFGGVLRLSSGRLLRLELRRNAMMWMVPLMAAMFWFDTYRSSMDFPPMFGPRSLYLQYGKELPDFAPFIAGAAAWMGSRDGRRGVADQVAVTTLPRWAGRLAVWAATTGWALFAYLGCVGALYGVNAWQGVTGVPPWWPVVVGAVVVTAVSTFGIAAGLWFPGRFAAPVAAITALLVLLVDYRIRSGSPYMLISPLTSPLSRGAPDPQGGVFFPYLPDLAIVQVMVVGGAAVAVLGALGVQAVCGGRGTRGAAAAVLAAGVAVAGTGVGLAGTARVQATGVVVPALHDAAGDRPLSYTPVCGRSAVQVCLNPVYRAYVPAVTAALDPVLREVAGLTGAPQRVTQVRFAGDDGGEVSTLAMSGSVLTVALDVGIDGAVCFGSSSRGVPAGPPLCATATSLWTSRSLAARVLRPRASAVVIDHVVGQGSPAGQVVSAALMTALGVRPADPSVPGSPPDIALTGQRAKAAERFAALPAASRHAWLAAHLADLRAGRVAVADLP